MSQGVAERPRTRAARRRTTTAAAWFWPGVAGTTVAVTVFLAHQLMAWPPHEDETLALFVGRDSLGGLLDQVLRERGGAPLHFLVAWGVAHGGFGLGALRLVSAACAVASLPLVALLARRLAGPLEAVVAAALVACSWALLFHGVYGRMYSLFLLLSLTSYLALLRALDAGRTRDWIGWCAAALLVVAAHPYGVLVLGSQAAFVLLAHRNRLGQALRAGAVVAALGTPFWITDLVLAGRFDVGVGTGGARLGDPVSVARYLARTAGDFTAGWWWALVPALALAGVGFVTVRRETRLLCAAVVGAPTIAFLLTRLGGSASPETRHLVFALPFLALLIATAVTRIGRRAPAVATAAAIALLVVEVGWAWHRTAPLFEWEPDQRQRARAEAEDYLARTGRPDDVLLGYDPLFLGAWERNRHTSSIVLPRADATLALETLREQPLPLGRGVWVFDASRRNNAARRLEIEPRSPSPPTAFEVNAFGPFLVIRTREPTTTPASYLERAARALLVGQSLGIGDVAINMATIERAARELRGYGSSSRLRSDGSR